MGIEEQAEQKEQQKVAKKAEKQKKRQERKKRSKSFFAEFKKFIMRGNIIDLAVAVVIGTAFNAIVNGMVNYIIMPVIGLLTGGINLESWKLVLVDAKLDEAGEIIEKEVAILWGSVLQAILNFLLIALVIFLVLRIRTKAAKKMEDFRSAEQKVEDEKKKQAEKEKAAAAAAEAKQKLEREQAYYDNIARQTELLTQIAQRLQAEKSDS